jgi:hydrogenase maturation protease
MRVIIGCGNELRGEDAFGIDVLQKLQKLHLPDTKLISTHQLTPEIALDLLDANEIIFIDAAYSVDEIYTLSCPILKQNNLNVSHHIEPKYIIEILRHLYHKDPAFYVYSMGSCSFDKIKDKKRYNLIIDEIVSHLSETKES